MHFQAHIPGKPFYLTMIIFILLNCSDVKFLQTVWSPQYFFLYLKQAFFVVRCSPPHQLNHPPGNFNAGDSGWINTTARIEIGKFSLSRILITVRMAADQHRLMFFDPFVKILFYLMPFVYILYRAGRIFYSECMHMPPEIFYR